MLEIALEETGNSVFQKDIAKNQDISIKYLDHIIQALKTAGLIVNIKGKKSGYVLTRPAAEITMLDIHNAFEGNVCVIDCMDSNVICEREQECCVKGFWGGLNILIIDYFKGITLENLKKSPELQEECRSEFK